MMRMFRFVLPCSVALTFFAFGSIALAQAGGGGMGGGGFIANGQISNGPSTTLMKPNTETALDAQAILDTEFEGADFDLMLGKLDDELTQVLGVPVFVDSRGITMAQLKFDTPIKTTIAAMPVRSALRHLLQPLGLRITVEDEGLVVTADFTELAGRGIATSKAVGGSTEAEAITAAFNKKISVEFAEMPLSDAMDQLSMEHDLPILIDRRALEEIGLTDDTPVNLRMKAVSLRSVLRLMLRELDLTYMIKDETLQITTIEAAEQNLVNRIYFLEATGFAVGDFNSVMQIIETVVVPDTWEALGGPSTMAPLLMNRPALIISTTSDVHDQIEDILRTMRENHVGPDPIVDQEATEKKKKTVLQSGGMF